jgi:hypothetical protein
MKLSIGIVGLPNVGKSTLFNALLKKQVADVANYPFCTIEPNVGVIEVPDERLPVLAKIVKTEKIVPAIVEFYDIAGLVRGASKGEGLGNQFLSHIREVATIIHVVRLFEDENVIHISNKIEPKGDIETIEAELILADLATLEKQSQPFDAQGKPRMNATKEELSTYEVIKLLRQQLNKGIPARKITLSHEQTQAIKHLNLLTIKPVIFVFNISEKQLEKYDEICLQISAILKSAGEEKTPYIPINAKLENEVLALSPSEQLEYLKQFHLTDSGLNRLIKEAYKNLHLISFLTAGEKEARAWTIKKGMLAPQAAGVIHTDFEKHFIKADVIPYETFVADNGWISAREKGEVQTVGKNYEIKDGEVVEFKIGI